MTDRTKASLLLVLYGIVLYCTVEWEAELGMGKARTRHSLCKHVHSRDVLIEERRGSVMGKDG